MNELSIEERHLEEADAHIRKAERSIADQERLFLAAARNRSDLAEAHRLLSVMRQTLEQFHAHRRLIVERIDALTRVHPPPP
jgi:alpha-D-ribose 1-methylphosphonate 5-triphosphate synthase subunit PhnI